ncbi:hypothetical protein GCM10023318_49310 [Nocardia callitridis]|uniref:Uncharacterized protein n=1 Tax=Nocardia callitridis TaxID=648753 RepID=A0ABP9KQQ6_9NOCA
MEVAGSFLGRLNNTGTAAHPAQSEARQRSALHTGGGADLIRRFRTEERWVVGEVSAACVACADLRSATQAHTGQSWCGRRVRLGREPNIHLTAS